MFTLMRMISHPEPPQYRGDPDDVDLSPEQIDDLVGYQIDLPNPSYLTPGSFFVAGLTDLRSTSEKIYKALQKASILSITPADKSCSPVNTAAIDKSFARRLPFISDYTRRKLVGMLFFWEEQCDRWRLLDEERAQIPYALGQEGADSEELDVALQRVQQKKRLLPSQLNA